MSLEDITEEMNFEDCYSLGDFLSKGQFGNVYSCIDNESHEEYTVKIKDTGPGDNLSLHREGSIWRRLKHRNIVELFRVFNSLTTQYLVMENISGGNLFDQIVKFTTYTENDACYFMKQLFDVLIYLREKQVIHRNIRSDNLILKETHHGEILKLTDFDLAVRLKKGEKEISLEPNGVPLHVAPETILEKPVGFGVDIWASGVILYTLLAGYPPFWNERPDKLYADIITKNLDITSPFWDNVSNNAKDLIRKLLEKNPDKRINSKEVLSHPWILEHNNNPKMHRKKTVEKLKEFNARRKLRGAIFMVQTLYRMQPTKTKRSVSTVVHSGNKSPMISRKISSPVLPRQHFYSDNRQNNNHEEDFSNQRKVSQVKMKYNPVKIVINLDETVEEK